MIKVKLFNDSAAKVFPNGAAVKPSEDKKTVTVVDADGAPASDAATFEVSKVEHIVKK